MRTIVGVMGGGSVDAATENVAREVGRLIAEQGWVLLNGGRACGVMAASAEGAHEAGGLTVGVLPDEDTAQIADAIDIPILTGMGDARNVINVLSGQVIIALPGNAGTISEVAHALKLGRPVITLGLDVGDLFPEYRASRRLVNATSPQQAIKFASHFVAERASR